MLSPAHAQLSFFLPLSIWEFQELEHINVWTEEETQIFFNRFMLYPKKFDRIAAALPNKTTADCVLYYYRTKKQVKYKERREEVSMVGG